MVNFKYLSISDIHYGHRKNTTSKIKDNFSNFIREYHDIMINLDAIFVVGDIYDRLIASNSQELQLINEWFNSLLKFCKINNIILRVIEGTMTHDYRQASGFSTVINGLDLGVDYKYYSDVSIEILKNGLSVLYIPDNMGKPNDIYEKVLRLMSELKLDKIDLAFVHGEFPFMLNGYLTETAHNEALYLAIVRYYIHCGHIHTPRFYDRILGNGSFDRLAHGEEEKKGCIYVKINDVNFSYLFLENKNASKFKTIKCVTSDTIETIYLKIVKYLKTNMNVVSIKLLVSDSNLIQFNIKDLRHRLPEYLDLMVEVIKDDVNMTTVTLETVIREVIDINEDNIYKLMTERLEKYNLNTSDYLSVKKLLTEASK